MTAMHDNGSNVTAIITPLPNLPDVPRNVTVELSNRASCPSRMNPSSQPLSQDWELTKGSVPWASAVRRWAEMQDGQRILLTTPSVLVGFRVEVYRAEGTTQWYTAVIVGYNESTKDLTVTDDTVLEDHNEDPSLVQMRLIGDGVVESIMRGEVVGMTPRRSRSSTALTHALVVFSTPSFLISPMELARDRTVTTHLDNLMGKTLFLRGPARNDNDLPTGPPLLKQSPVCSIPDFIAPSVAVCVIRRNFATAKASVKIRGLVNATEPNK
ncbi:hypothetical protein K0M31_018487 [Melipona bicolor]|uniref:Lysine-specific demethylase 3A/B tudor domain-containing protein n=1 Tax=Melipona bicolor TaxID=60889 RepID=A0AA40G3F8_9HYME|nr:hypothetical protein K0M31_018487 [Melipona bicolor]